MKKILLALILSAGLVSAPVLFTGCAGIQGIFQTDPVGASLKTTKDTYEATVKTAGRLYVSGQINEAQLRKFRDEANKFYNAYTELATIHEVVGVKEGDFRLEQLSRLLNILVNMVTAFQS